MVLVDLVVAGARPEHVDVVAAVAVEVVVPAGVGVEDVVGRRQAVELVGAGAADDLGGHELVRVPSRAVLELHPLDPGVGVGVVVRHLERVRHRPLLVQQLDVEVGAPVPAQ